jgi:hypothetical protein
MPATEKISVTIGRKELGHAKRLATRLGVSLSGFITDALRERVREQERREAALQVLATFSPEDRASPAEAQVFSDHVARLAGVALSLVPRAQTIDALVMASACQRANEVVYTSDLVDLEALRDGVPQFASIRIERA